MKSHLNWMDTPVTWGVYFKLAGICAVIGTVISAMSCVIMLDPAWWQATKDFTKRLFKN